MANPEASRTTNRLLGAIVVLLLLFLIKLAAPVFIAVLLAVLLVYVLDPLVVLLARRMPTWTAVLLTVLAFAVFFAGVGTVLLLDAAHFGATFTGFQDEIVRRAEAAVDALGGSFGLSVPLEPLEQLRNLQISRYATTAARSAVLFLSEFGIIFFFALILLLGKHRVAETISEAFPRTHSRVPAILEHIDWHLRVYLGIKTLSSLAIGLLTGAILAAFRVEFAAVWGLLAFLLNFVPTLGPIAAIVAPVMIAVVQFDAFLRPLLVAGSLVALHLGISNGLEPVLMREQLKLSFFVIFLSLFVWGWLWGAPGVLLAVPLTTSMKIVLENVPQTERFARLLGGVRRSRSGEHGD